MVEVASGLRFPEGPVALEDGGVLLVEVAGCTLTRVSPDAVTAVVAQLHSGPNGAAIGPDGRCYICNGGLTFHETANQLLSGLAPEGHAGGWIEAVDLESGQVEVLYRACGDMALKGPNDLVFDAHGGFYFSDSGKVRRRDRDRGAVFYAHSDGTFVRQVVFPVESANGIGLSPDGQTLYVAEAAAARISACALTAPGQMSPAASASFRPKAYCSSAMKCRMCSPPTSALVGQT